MKYLFAATLIITVLFAFTSCEESNKKEVPEVTTTDNTDYTKQNEALLTLLKKETKVKKVEIVKSAALVYVDSDGTNRGGYASGLCNYVKDTDSKNIVEVWIMSNGSEKLAKKDIEQGNIIGMCDCVTFEIK